MKFTEYDMSLMTTVEFSALTGITPDTFDYLFARYCGKGTPVVPH